MKTNEFVQLVAFFGLLVGLAPLLGRFLARVFQGERTFLHPVLHPIEKLTYKFSGVDPAEEMSWKRYFLAVLMFNVVGMFSLWVLQMAQAWLPLNPQHYPNVPWALALNTAISFVTNTNWQNYAGETTMSYLTQMAGLAVHNFLSAATGIAILIAFARGLKRSSSKTLGNFWTDLTRTTLYVLLPLSVVVALVLVSQGVVQSFKTLCLSQSGGVLHDPGAERSTTRAIRSTAPTANRSWWTPKWPPSPFRSGRPPRKSPSSNWAPTAAASTARTARIRLKTPRRSAISSRCWPDHRGRLPGVCVRPDGRQRAARLVLVWRDAGACCGLLCGRVVGESQPNPVMGNVGRYMEGKEQRFGVMNSVLFADRDHGDFLRRGQFHARQFHAAGGPDAPVEHDARRCIVFGGVGAGSTASSCTF